MKDGGERDARYGHGKIVDVSGVPGLEDEEDPSNATWERSGPAQGD